MLPDQSIISLAGLELGVYAFDASGAQQAYLPKGGRPALCKELGLSDTKPYHALFNKEVLVYAPALGLKVYLVSVVKAFYPVVMTKVGEFVSQPFSKLSLVLQELFKDDPTQVPNQTTFSKKHLVMGHPYTHTDGCKYIFEYLDPEVRTKRHEGMLASARKSKVRARACEQSAAQGYKLD